MRSERRCFSCTSTRSFWSVRPGFRGASAPSTACCGRGGVGMGPSWPRSWRCKCWAAPRRGLSDRRLWGRLCRAAGGSCPGSSELALHEQDGPGCRVHLGRGHGRPGVRSFHTASVSGDEWAGPCDVGSHRHRDRLALAATSGRGTACAAAGPPRGCLHTVDLRWRPCRSCRPWNSSARAGGRPGSARPIVTDTAWTPGGLSSWSGRMSSGPAPRESLVASGCPARGRP